MSQRKAMADILAEQLSERTGSQFKIHRRRVAEGMHYALSVRRGEFSRLFQGGRPLKLRELTSWLASIADMINMGFIPSPANYAASDKPMIDACPGKAARLAIMYGDGKQPEPKLEPMTEREAQEYGPQWGSYMSAGDPGAIMYSRIPPERPEHRDTMIAWLQDHCRPIASLGDRWQIRRMIAYLQGLTY